jgi:hypothetical protein
VAQRRVTQKSSASQSLDGLKRDMLGRIEEEERNRFRPLEDPYLVGEEAANRARRERLALENDDVLTREDQRWDWFLGKEDPSTSPPFSLVCVDKPGAESDTVYSADE